MVLHTWGQTLQLHPHVHVIVPGGGFGTNGQSWVSCRPNYFLSVKVLGRVFRGKLLAFLREAYDAGELPFAGGLAHLAQPDQFLAWCKDLYGREWNVYCKPPFGGAERVLKYVARYTYRVAISNDRLEAITDNGIRFRYKDYSAGGKWRRMCVPADEFLRRFSQHILPRGLVRIRAFGFLAGANRNEQLARCRKLLSVSSTSLTASSASESVALDEPPHCPHCHKGVLQLVEDCSRPRVPELVGRTYQSDGMAGLTAGDTS